MKRTLKNLALIAIVAFFAVSCTSVEPGFKALKVYKLGDKKGEMEVVGVGDSLTTYSAITRISTIQQMLRESFGKVRIKKKGT